ncbi:LT Antigen [California sea lion polyomavirus 2]|nr:LT Antigen [California sea lion polyomavirus 2]
MESVLTKEEKTELLQLLELNPSCYGNVPLMQAKYKRAALKYHPDKGGDEEKMKRLNVLFTKFFSGCAYLREDNPTPTYEDIPQYGTSAWERWWENFNANEDDDLCCSESLDSSDDEGPTTSKASKSSPTASSSKASRSPRTPPCAFSPPESPDSPPKKKRRTTSPDASQQSFSTPPKQKKKPVPEDFPEDIRPFLSNAILSNRTLNAFAIYTTKEKAIQLGERLNRFNYNYQGLFQFNDFGIILMLTVAKHRTSAIANFCKKECTHSFCITKAVLKVMECYATLSKDPYIIIRESPSSGLNDFLFEDPTNKPPPGLNWVQLSEFAVQIKCEDPLLLMGIYLDFAKPLGNCTKCSARILKLHYQNHEKQHENAILFKECKSQKNACQQAVDAYMASKRLMLLESSRQDILCEKFNEMFEKMEDVFVSSIPIIQHMAGVAWLSCLLPDIDDLVVQLLQYFVDNIPKRRYVCFKGPINSGKTTLAAALLNLVSGKTLNINCPSDKLNFELGCAIDQFIVVFEDVKGQIGENKNLIPGQGMHNLDNLRDHLDGSVKVNLERKHMNKRSQIFPPGIITMNEYQIPLTLQARFVKTVTFRPKQFLRTSIEKNQILMQMRVIQSGLTLLALLVWWQPVAAFDERLQQKVVYWKEVLGKYVPLTMFTDMKANIQNGKDPLCGIIYEEEDEEEEIPTQTNTEDSGVVP